MKSPGEIHLIMARTGGDYEYTDWPIAWRSTGEHAEALVRDLTKRVADLNALVPPCPAVEDSDRRWALYERREKKARETCETELGVGLDAEFFVACVPFDPAESSVTITSTASADGLDRDAIKSPPGEQS